MIRNKDDTVLVEGKKISLETTESGIHILPLEKDEKKPKREPEARRVRNVNAEILH